VSLCQAVQLFFNRVILPAASAVRGPESGLTFTLGSPGLFLVVALAGGIILWRLITKGKIHGIVKSVRIHIRKRIIDDVMIWNRSLTDNGGRIALQDRQQGGRL
jgi:hypothetical protein